MSQTPTPIIAHSARSPMQSRVQVSLGRRVQATPAQKHRRLTTALGYSFLREIIRLGRGQQSQAMVEEMDDLHHLLHRAQAFLAETRGQVPGISLPQIRSYLNRWTQDQHRRVTLRLQIRRGRVYLWRMLRPTVMAETELVWQVAYTLLDRLISSLVQWKQNADGRQGRWQRRLQQGVGLAERFLEVTAELESVFWMNRESDYPFIPIGSISGG